MKTRIILVVAIFLFGFPQIICAQNNSFVLNKFKVPDKLENEHLRIRMLTVNDEGWGYRLMHTQSRFFLLTSPIGFFNLYAKIPAL